MALEDYIRERVAQLPEPAAHISRNADSLSIDITDTTGEEKFDSIRAFRPARFYDGTKEIKLIFRAYRPTSLQITISFSGARDNSFVRLEFEGDAAREFVVGFRQGIEQILSQWRTKNNWFHLPLVASVLLIELSLALFVFGLVALIAGVKWATPLLTGAVTVGGYLGLGLLKPYSTFDSPRSETNKRVSNWLLTGVVGFLLFTVLGVYLRGRVLGF